MISFTTPENGWLGLDIRSEGLQLHYQISDVGPDSLARFRQLARSLDKEPFSTTIECNLEPTLLLLAFNVGHERVSVIVSEDGEPLHAFEFPKDAFTSQLMGELDRIDPLCIDPHWIQA